MHPVESPLPRLGVVETHEHAEQGSWVALESDFIHVAQPTQGLARGRPARKLLPGGGSLQPLPEPPAVDPPAAHQEIKVIDARRRCHFLPFLCASSVLLRPALVSFKRDE